MRVKNAVSKRQIKTMHLSVAVSDLKKSYNSKWVWGWDLRHVQ